MCYFLDRHFIFTVELTSNIDIEENFCVRIVVGRRATGQETRIVCAGGDGKVQGGFCNFRCLGHSETSTDTPLPPVQYANIGFTKIVHNRLNSRGISIIFCRESNKQISTNCNFLNFLLKKISATLN